MKSSNNKFQDGERICSPDLLYYNIKNIQFLIKKNYEACEVTKYTIHSEEKIIPEKGL